MVVRFPYPPLRSWAFLPPGRCVFCILVCVLASFSITQASAPDKASTGGDLGRFADVRIDESEALDLIKRIRKTRPTREEAAAWARVANSDKYSDVRRRRAVLQLFDRNVHLGMTLGEIADVLAKPSWLGRQNVHWPQIFAGYGGMDAGEGERVFIIAICLPRDDESTVEIRVEGKPSTDAVFETLQGKATDAAAFRINAILIYTHKGEDRKVGGWAYRVWPAKLRWADNWEITFSKNDLEAYARQLDFFGINLVAITLRNKLVYVSHLSGAKPDIHIMSKRADEMRHYLALRDDGFQRADRDLLSCRPRITLEFCGAAVPAAKAGETPAPQVILGQPLRRAGIDAGTDPILLFLPPAIEAKLAALERSYRGADPRKVERTRFGVRAAGSGFSFYVLEQTLKESNTPRTKKGGSTGVTSGSPKK